MGCVCVSESELEVNDRLEKRGNIYSGYVRGGHWVPAEVVVDATRRDSYAMAPLKCLHRPAK